MIDFIRGAVAHIEADYIVLDVNGVGYRVFTPNPYLFQSRSEHEATVYIHHHVREDAILLFGFGTREEQSLFRRLLDVSGIGPKVALGILSGGRPEAVVAAIQQENVNFLTKLPGIGKKTAQRMILDLKDKLLALATTGSDMGSSLAYELPTDSTASNHAWREAKEGLMALGYSEAEIDRILQKIKPLMKEDDPVEVLVKLALQALYKG